MNNKTKSGKTITSTLCDNFGFGLDPNIVSVRPSPESYTAVSMEVNAAFGSTGDGARNRAPLLQELVDNGVRLLVYTGDADMSCNYIVCVSSTVYLVESEWACW